jgi:hypothetical protein
MGAWLAIAGFGAYHGLNPAMGWLFALALGLQQRSERAIWVALAPIALGHAASVGLVAGAVLALGAVVSRGTLELVAAACLLVFGAYKLHRYARHPRWVGMRVGVGDLFAWSFLMATAHGAGLMIAPLLVAVASPTAAHEHAMPHERGALGMALCVHTGAMLLVMAIVARIVYRRLGLAVLRRSWVNFDLIWAVALLVVGAVALGRGLWALGARA